MNKSGAILNTKGEVIMPELPEVETIKKALQGIMPGRIIEKVEVFSPAMREPFDPGLGRKLTGKKIMQIRRRGRYLMADLDDQNIILMHLGMSGVIRIEEVGFCPRRKHEHLHLHLSGGLIYKFECTRRFSIFKCCSGSGTENLPEECRRLGAEPLSEEFTGGMLAEMAAGRKVPVKAFLMDNAIVTGIGNIYATETLFAARISPGRPAASLCEAEWGCIVKEAKRILEDAIRAGGSSISDFLHVDGSEGKFSQQLAVYGKAASPCPRCGTILTNLKIGGRSSYCCPKCQI